MNYHDWKKGIGVNSVKSAGDNTYFFQRDGTDLGVLGVLFDGQLKKDPFCDRLGKSPHFTDVCKAIYNSLAASNIALHGMRDIQQILIGAALIYGRIPINKSGKASYDKSNGQGYHHLPFNSVYKSAFESGFSVGLLANDLLAVMDASRKDNLEWRAWFTRKHGSESMSSHTKALTESEDPTREDVVKILPRGKEVDEDLLKNALELLFGAEKRALKPGWWERTKQNLLEWSKKG